MSIHAERQSPGDREETTIEVAEHPSLVVSMECVTEDIATSDGDMTGTYSRHSDGTEG